AADADAALRWAESHGYPVAVKAAGGGGGRGFRVAPDAAALPEAFAGAAGEASRSFANPVVYLERYLTRPRHVEVQVFADRHGHAIAVGDRDCSIQRRHQKLIEEAPAPGVPAETRRRMAEAAVALAQAVGYEGAGTVEFLLLPDGSFYFLEMNTRIQVEHPVTEMVTGIDLVKEQIRVAAGAPLSFGPVDVAPRGHAIECRVNAEDPGRGFAPAPGPIVAYAAPAGFGVRVDSAAEAGAVILPAYDSLIAKLIAWGRDRNEAIARMARALADFTIDGVPTTIPYDRAVLASPAFAAADLTTDFVADHPELIPAPAPPPASDGAASPAAREAVVEVNGRRFNVRLHDEGARTRPVRPTPSARRARSERKAPDVAANGADLRSPIQGTVVRVLVDEGQALAAGDVVCVVEAMKMENDIVAHRAGTISALAVAPGANVSAGDRIATIA
ncbi:MAG TPA: biotin/lipoyl-containing protein, partial [Thermomicrobiales bacterium]|nr:biotin/lipoyl-containing protein [Thermomicrobiales bacterium]